MSGDRAEPDVDLRFDHDPRAAATARDALRAALADLPGLGDVLLVASELVSNVFNHTDDGGKLRLWCPDEDGRVLLEVHDPDPKLPVALEGGAGGHGLAIVDAVTRNWGIDRTLRGKVVWAEFASPNISTGRPG